MRCVTFLLAVVLFNTKLQGQKLVLVRDSIMNSYMKSGFATNHFVPKGKIDADNKRQGKWLDYETREDGSYQTVDNKPMKTISMYLLYGEGEFLNNERTGNWNIYVIEDKTFKKILCKTVTYINGKENGSFKYFYPDGSVAQTGNYKSGNLEDSSFMYYLNQKIFGEQFYKDNKKEGIQKYYFQSGKPLLIVNYSGGLREGKYESYYENGKVEESFACKKDSIDGIYRYYYSTGNLWTETIYSNGLLLNISTVLDKDGKALDKGTLIDGNGYINYYSEEGKRYSRVFYQNGKKVKEE